MIRNFADKETEVVWLGRRSRKLPADIQQRALGRLAMLDAAGDLDDLRTPPSNRLHALARDRTGQHSISINDQWRIYASSGVTEAPTMSKLSTTIDDQLHNPHAGELLASEFLEPLQLDIDTVAGAIGVPAAHLFDVIDGGIPMDADLDLRLGRYLGMSEGFFLRLQHRYALLEAKRSLDDVLDRIVPRAA